MHASSSGSSANDTSPTPSAAGSAASLDPSAMSAGATMPTDDSSKLKTFLGILKKFVGVSDIATVRFSLPAQLLEPQPNLEYWNYLDRPETFVSIGDSEDPLERMLAVLRFWFTKDLKYVKGKPCKPYNSVLGEFFRCNWEVEDNLLPALSPSPGEATNTVNKEPLKPVKVSYLTEQTSHHPPVSAFYVDCPEKGISARGFDQISAKFTGTSIRVTPGAHNLGIFITLHNRENEQYQLTHPAAYLGGLLRGALSVTVSDVCYITCPKTKIKVILHYLEEGWLGKTLHRVDGVVFKYDPENDTKSKIKDVPEADILARIEGSWVDKIFVTLPGSTDKILLVDLNPLLPVSKIVPLDEDQLPNESRKFWAEVTRAIHARDFGKATQLKHEIEERQRQKAAAWSSRNEEWKPRFFVGTVTPVGRPSLTKDGEEALRGLHEGRYKLQPSVDV
ncbi:hypothetical protein FGG08_003215 [Glutinoglossum americanum]|uniref:Oxysterol-binding protein n=1 Tax=Glutinoglossum americanum TaxID=1670608 RepID=A0A9P8L0V3_9PEZI|nr:hypothetical protein FGG08_003215 [Glutinoglossum americanum]